MRRLALHGQISPQSNKPNTSYALGCSKEINGVSWRVYNAWPQYTQSDIQAQAAADFCVSLGASYPREGLLMSTRKYCIPGHNPNRSTGHRA
jgi:hypothetical protein